MENSVSVELIATKILVIRGKRVMLDRDLSKLYGVSTKRLNEQVKRNIRRFPEDFMFQLSWEEAEYSRSQNATLEQGKNVKYLPYAFTEHGVAMLSSVLNSEKAVEVNIQIIRAFVKLRHILSVRKEFEMKLRELKDKLEEHDADINDIFEAMRQLMGIPEAKKVVKGFTQK